MPDASIRDCTTSTKPSEASCWTATFTERVSCPWSHETNWRQASRSTHAPIGTMRPLRSISGMKRIGAMTPCTGWCQRRSASTPDTRRSTRETIGWNTRRNSSRSSAPRRPCSKSSRSTADSRIETSKTSHRPLPSSFARYIAVSASRRIVFGSMSTSRGPLNRSPTDADTYRGTLATTSGARSASARRPATCTACCSSTIPGNRTENSSPPNLARTSSGRSTRLRRSATAVRS